MEYCERSTLRNVIDEDLYKKPDLVGRYFREIVEGLAHVHSQVRLNFFTKMRGKNNSVIFMKWIYFRELFIEI